MTIKTDPAVVEYLARTKAALAGLLRLLHQLLVALPELGVAALRGERIVHCKYGQP